MSSNYWLTEEQFRKISPLLTNKPRSFGDHFLHSARVSLERCAVRIWSGQDRYKRWSEAGVFERIFEALAQDAADLSTLMIDASHVKTHRIAANGVKKTPATGVASAKPKAV